MADRYLHQQASLTTGTIAYNDELSTDFRHLERRVIIERERVAYSSKWQDRGFQIGGRVGLKMDIRQLVVEREVEVARQTREI